jgi:hypothetical protein
LNRFSELIDSSFKNEKSQILYLEIKKYKPKNRNALQKMEYHILQSTMGEHLGLELKNQTDELKQLKVLDKKEVEKNLN